MEYIDQKGRNLFVSSGISGGEMWGTFFRKPTGSLKRVTSKSLPMRHSKQIAQDDLDRYAIKKKLIADERDGCVAGCPECIWGGKFPAKDCCEGHEPLTSQRPEVRNQRSDK
jgi:hypothetical protein